MRKKDDTTIEETFFMSRALLDMDDELVKQIKTFINTLRPQPFEIVKTPSYDSNSGQLSINIPKELSDDAGIKKDTEFHIVHNPDGEKSREIVKSKFVIYIKEDGKQTKSKD